MADRESAELIAFIMVRELAAELNRSSGTDGLIDRGLKELDFHIRSTEAERIGLTLHPFLRETPGKGLQKRLDFLNRSIENANLAGDVMDTGVRTSEKSLRNKLAFLYHSIDEEDRRVEAEDSEKIWVKQMRAVAERIEDVVDMYYVLAASQQRGFVNYLSSRLRGNRGYLGSILNNIAALLLDLGERKRVRIFDDRHQYHRPLIYLSPEEFLQGIAPAVGVLLRNYLVGGEPSESTVSVVAADEIGKTTLAKVFDDEAVKEHFGCRAWIAVLDLNHKSQLLKLLAEQVCTEERRDGGSLDAMSDEELVNALRRCLRLNRFLLVFEDVRKEEFWYVIKDVLPDDNKGSRIIITTHSDAVAAACKMASFGHDNRTEPLSEEMAQELLSKMASRHDLEPHYRYDLAQASLEIIKICESSPLAIVAVAGLLLTKEKFPQQWRKLLENFSLEVQPNAHLRGVSDILTLGFLDLPHQVKSCFLYLNIFSEEPLIPTNKLFKLWIAEGFVRQETGKTLEEVAQEYLNMLIDRNLVQAHEGFYGIEKFCGVHSLMREFSQKKADEHSFCQIWGVQDSSFRGRARRLLISNRNVENVLETVQGPWVRSVILSNIGDLKDSVLVRLFEKYKLLTLLDIENSPLDIVPKEVGNLLCLKYLSLKNTKVKSLPKSVNKLHKLQTLDLTSTLLVELPMEIFKLQNLRHLLASRCDNKIRLDPGKGVIIRAGISYLLNLQTLMTVEAHPSGMDVIQELKRLRRLRSLSVSRLTAELASALCECIEAMSHLQSLRLYSMNDQSLDLRTILSPPPHLEQLVLKGFLHTFPVWISSLQNLSMLCLSLSKLADNPLQHLCLLPNLESLWLYQAYEGEKLQFQKDGLKKLKLLVLRELQGLERVEIEEGALPLLEELRIGPSPLLNEVPSGIKYLRNLKVVSFYDMPNDFVLSMQPDGGSENWKVEHVPSVLFWYRDEGKRYISYWLGKADLLDRLEGLNTKISNASQRDFHLSFCYSDDEDDLASTSTVQWNEIPQSSFSSDRFSFFTDDVEE